jgi:DNA-binding LytR/AlgR family response regulator
MIRIIALDDEPPALDIVETFCRRLTNVQLKGKFTKTSEALAYLEEFSVDLLLLDINMPAVSGIDFYKGLPHRLMVIFITSYSEYAVESYNVNAVDYLLKPFTFHRFQQAIDKAIVQQEVSRRQEAAREKYLVLRLDYGLVKVAVIDILVVEGLDNYMKIHLSGQKPITIRATMKALMDKLPSNEFVRVHRSYIVALSRIESVRKKMIVIAGMEVPVSSSYEEDFNNLFTPPGA